MVRASAYGAVDQWFESQSRTEERSVGEPPAGKMIVTVGPSQLGTWQKENGFGKYCAHKKTGVSSANLANRHYENKAFTRFIIIIGNTTHQNKDSCWFQTKRFFFFRFSCYSSQLFAKFLQILEELSAR